MSNTSTVLGKRSQSAKAYGPSGATLVEVIHTGIRLRPDLGRVITKPFLAHTGGLPDSQERLRRIAQHTIDLDQETIEGTLEDLRKGFQTRHRDIEAIWESNLSFIGQVLPDIAQVSDRSLRLLLGATFTQEYAIEGAALTNPSIVSVGGSDFILSLRAIGEGHISSIEFRSGRQRSDGEIEIDSPGPYAAAGRRSEVLFERDRFASKLAQMDAEDEIADEVLGLLPQQFDSTELGHALKTVTSKDRVHPLQAETTTHVFRWLASSNYELVFDNEPLSERVLFPAGPSDSNGMEDARFVRFTEDDGSVTYFATYTAFDGIRILPQLISTADFVRFRVSSLHGSCAQNKGMALFPRRIDGKFVALSRHDQTNLHVLWAEEVWDWNLAERLTVPKAPWEAVQVGNCGSPIETAAGWLVITHGVGPMRTYRLGALLLDLEEPERIVGRLQEPLLSPDWSDRDGYVPNVVYSCGSLIHEGRLLLPYGIADREVGIGVVDVDRLLAAMA
ncbi:MAG TPA: glycoside hydrolase family 130 protein [Acidimicrobiia bacterium]|nr:glycoside hydrolase family 130 protein [Acidimicrobiia bacterium]